MKRALDIGLLVLCLVCGGIFLLRNAEAKTLFPASSSLEAPTWSDGLLQRDEMKRTTGGDFLCRADCSEVRDWPGGADAEAWFQSIGQGKITRGVGDRPDAPALIFHEGRWVVLWGERSDRLEVVVQGRGAGVWPRAKYKELYGSPWWGPLK